MHQSKLSSIIAPLNETQVTLIVTFSLKYILLIQDLVLFLCRATQVLMVDLVFPDQEDLTDTL